MPHKRTNDENKDIENKDKEEKEEKKDKEDIFAKNNRLLDSYENRNVINIDEYDKDDNSIIVGNNHKKLKESNIENINELIHDTTQSNIMDISAVNKADDNSKKKEEKGEKDNSIIEKVKDDNDNDDNNNEDNLDCINLGNDDLESEKSNNNDLISSQSQDNESKHSVMMNQMIPPPSAKKKKKKVKKVANPPSKTNEEISNDNNDDNKSGIDSKITKQNKNGDPGTRRGFLNDYNNIDNNSQNINNGRSDDNIENKNDKFFNSYSYFLDRKSYDYLIENINNKKLGDNRSFLEMLFSIIKSNSILMYICFFKIDDIKIKFSILILCINLYIFVTASLQFDMTMLLLYNNFWFGGLLIFAFISCLVSFPIIICKKYLSV